MILNDRTAASPALFAARLAAVGFSVLLAASAALSAPAGQLAPLNDTCAGAEPIPSCGPFPRFSSVVSLVSATSTGDPVPGCGKSAVNGVWFSFTPTSTAKYTFTTCADSAPGTTSPDTVLAIYNAKDNQCPQGGMIACNNDDSNCGDHPQQSTVTANLTAATRYFILAYAANATSTGNVQVSVTTPADPINGGFETGDFTDWQTVGVEGDLAVVASNPPPACFQPTMPSDGCFMACFSNGTFFGGMADGGVRTDLTSGAINFSKRPRRIRVRFTVNFQTEESTPSTAFNDSFQASLVTNAGTFLILQIDSFGRTPNGKGLSVVGNTGFTTSPNGCQLNDGRQTGLLAVTWNRNFDPFTASAVGLGPVFVNFSISHQGNQEKTSIACVDEVSVVTE